MGTERVARDDVSREAFRALMDQASDGIFIADETGRYVDVNRSGCEMLGYPREELLGRSVTDLVHPDDLGAARLPIDAARSREGTLSERRLVRRDGQRVFAEISVTHLGDGRSLSIVRDVTKRRETEAAVRRSEASFRALIEQLPDGVAVHREGLIVYVNPAARRILGEAEGRALLGRPVLDIVHPDDRPAVAERVRTMMTKGVAADLRRERFVRPDGTVLDVEVVAVPVIFDGRPSIVAIARDVTERTRLQAQLAQSDRLASVGLLAAGVAHEINNPLTYTLLNLERLVRRLAVAEEADAAGAREELVAAARDAMDGARRVQKIVRDLKTFARSDADERRPVDVVATLEAALSLADNEIRFRAKVVRDYAPLPAVMGDAGRLAQVFLNLLVNAVHALDERRADRNEIRVRTSTRRGSACIEVLDTGRGIPREQLGRLFDPFFTTKAPGMGSGLGLAMCHGIVTAHGGHIEVESTPGVGSRFAVYLPGGDVVSSAAAEAEPAPIPRAARRRRRVMLVDDERLMRNVLTTLLDEHFDVAGVEYGAAAMAHLQKDRRFDAIVCDLMMPEMSGMDFYAWLERELPELAPRVVLMTGGAFTARASELFERIPNRRIEKPFTADKLVSLIETVVAEAER